MVARTRTESVIDRSSPYNIIETSTDDEGDEMHLTSAEDSQTLPSNASQGSGQQVAASPPSSDTSGTDVYMDAMDILDDGQSGVYFSLRHLLESEGLPSSCRRITDTDTLRNIFQGNRRRIRNEYSPH